MMVLGLATTSFLVSLLAVAVIKQRFRQQLLDIPNERSSHREPTPRGGGLGFILAFALTSAIAAVTAIFPVSLEEVFWLGLVLTPLTIVGVIDDRADVPARIRYLVQVTAASFAVYHWGEFPQPWLTDQGKIAVAIAMGLTLIGMTALINFYNFMDGLDGLVAGVSAIQLTFLALSLNQPLFGLLVAGLLGFLVWNWSPAKIFMGDAGSTVLGASIAIALLHSPTPTVGWSHLAITLPLVSDAIYTLTRRLLKGENIFQAHRSHLYQRIQLAGWSHAQVAITYMLWTMIVGMMIGIWGTVGSWVSLILSVCAIAIGEIYLQTKSHPKEKQGI